MSQVLKVTSSLDTTGFKLGVKEMESATAKFGGGLTKSLTGMAAGFFGLTKIFDGIVGGIKDSVTELNSVMRNSQTFNIPIKRMLQWKEATEDVGVEMNGLVEVFGRMETAQREALENPSGPAGKAFAKLGISKEKQANTPGDLMLQEVLLAWKNRGSQTKDIPYIKDLGGRGIGQYLPLSNHDINKIEPGFSEREVRTVYEGTKKVKGAMRSLFDYIVSGTMNMAHTVKDIMTGDWVTPELYDALNPEGPRKGVKSIGYEKPIGPKQEKTPYQKLFDDQKAITERWAGNQAQRIEDDMAKSLAHMITPMLNMRSTGYNEQGIFLRGAPRGLTDSIPRQQLDVQTRIYNALQNAGLSSGF